MTETPSAGPSTRLPFYIPQFMKERGLAARDLHLFHGEVEIRGRALRALHRDADGQVTGVEIVDNGKHFFSAGGRRALFRSNPIGKTTLVLACGALPAIAVASLEPDLAATACVAGVGGNWTEAASQAALTLVAQHRLRQVLLAFAENEAGQRSAVAARTALLGAGLAPTALVLLPPPAPTWVAALVAARRGRLQAA